MRRQKFIEVKYIIYNHTTKFKSFFFFDFQGQCPHHFATLNKMTTEKSQVLQLLKNSRGAIAQAEVWPEMDDIGPLTDNPEEETTQQKKKG